MVTVAKATFEIPKGGASVRTVDISAETKKRRGRIPKEELTFEAATVIGIDPGGTTGWSLMRIDPEVLADSKADLTAKHIDHAHGQVDCGSRRGTIADHGISDGEFAGIFDLAKLCRQWPSAAVVIEDFTLRQFRQDRDLLRPVRITSGIGYTLWLDGRDYFTQGPADAKRVCSDNALRQWGLYDSYNGMQHARDADRHAILFLRKAKQSKAFREKAFPHLYGKGGPYYEARNGSKAN